MGRAILIDNFLPSETFNYITEQVTQSEYWNSNTLGDFVRDELWNYVTERVFARCGSCLLYTSPSPRDYAASRMPSSA